MAFPDCPRSNAKGVRDDRGGAFSRLRRRLYGLPALALALLGFVSVARVLIWRPGVPGVFLCAPTEPATLPAVVASVTPGLSPPVPAFLATPPPPPRGDTAGAADADSTRYASHCASLPARPIDPFGNVTVDLALALFHEDTSWAHRLLPRHWTPVLLSRDDAANPNNVLPNLAYEALAYTRYIIRHYDCLPDRVIFLHGHNPSNHFLGASAGRKVDMVPILLALKVSSLQPYIPLSLYGWNSTNIFNPLTGEITRYWREMHNVYVASGLEVFLGPLPFKLVVEFSAQFLVTRDAIRGGPLLMWRRLDEWLSAGSYCFAERAPSSLSTAILGPSCKCMTDKDVAIAFEYLWSFIFSGASSDHIAVDSCEIYDCAGHVVPPRIFES